MSDNFYEMAVQRRSIYNLGNNEVLPEAKIVALVERMVKQCPTAFNAQSGRVIVLFGENNQKLWKIVLESLRKIVPENAFAKTEERINSFAKGFGSVMYFVDDNITKKQQEDYPLYKNNFPVWAEQSNGMLQYMVWTALADEKIGASLQHYNEVIDDDVHQAWNVPKNWRLVAQMPFGSIEAPAGNKDYVPISERVKVFK